MFDRVRSTLTTPTSPAPTLALDDQFDLTRLTQRQRAQAFRAAMEALRTELQQADDIASMERAVACLEAHRDSPKALLAFINSDDLLRHVPALESYQAGDEAALEGVLDGLKSVLKKTYTYMRGAMASTGHIDSTVMRREGTQIDGAIRVAAEKITAMHKENTFIAENLNVVRLWGCSVKVLHETAQHCERLPGAVSQLTATPLTNEAFDEYVGKARHALADYMAYMKYTINDYGDLKGVASQDAIEDRVYVKNQSYHQMGVTSKADIEGLIALIRSLALHEKIDTPVVAAIEKARAEIARIKAATDVATKGLAVRTLKRYLLSVFDIWYTVAYDTFVLVDTTIMFTKRVIRDTHVAASK